MCSYRPTTARQEGGAGRSARSDLPLSLKEGHGEAGALALPATAVTRHRRSSRTRDSHESGAGEEGG